MKLIKWLTAGLTALTLVACGGGGGSGAGTSPLVPTPTTPAGGGTPAASTVELSTSAATIGSAAATATITAMVKDANNSAIAAAPIVFSVDTGTLSEASTVTGTTGTATAKLQAGSNKAARTITVTATSGTVSSKITVAVVVTQQKVELITGTVQIGSGGETATITALVKDENNLAVANAAVAFGTSSGTLSNVVTTTTAAGTATATLSAGADKSNRTATVTATSGTATSTVQVLINGTELQYGGPSTLQLGKSADIIVTLVDSSKVGIAGIPVLITSSLGNGLSASSVQTDSKGNAAFKYTATKAGSDTLSFSAIGATKTAALAVSGQDFGFVSPAIVAPATTVTVGVGVPQIVTVAFNVNGAPGTGTVAFSSTAGTVTPASVDLVNGRASATITSTTANPATVVARVGAAEATLPVTFVATDAASLVLQVSPTSLPPNPVGSTAQLVSVIATVRDANSNPVQGKVVNFSRAVDPSGGNLSQPSIVTNAAGQATVQYYSGPSTTPSNGVRLHAVVADKPSVFGDATLTVNQSALFIALGTSNVISNLSPELYKKDWVVYVTDSNGVAVPNVQITMKVLPISYDKGRLAWNGTFWAKIAPIYTCANEDSNYNGSLDAGEDINGSGKLEPGNVISVTPGTVTTDATGRATISLIYAESYVPWVQVTLRAEAVVTGTESSRQQTFVVEGLSSDFTTETVAPAGAVSPFGVGPCNLPN